MSLIWGFIISSAFFYLLGRHHGSRAFRDRVKDEIKSWLN